MENKHILSREKCPACNYHLFKSIFRRSFNENLIKKYMIEAYQGNADLTVLENVEFEIVKCKKCKLGFQKYIFDAQMLDELYNKWIDPNSALEWRDKGTKGTKTYEKILSIAKCYFKKDTSKIKVLDYGAGFGDSLVTANKMGFDSYAFEYSTERIRYLEGKGINVITNNSNMLFDFIIVNQILEHITNPTEILNDIHSKLDKTGLVYIAVPNCTSIEKKLKKTENITNEKELHKTLLDASVGAFQHINFFNNYNLKLLLKKQGFKINTPYHQAFVKPISIKSFIKPFYNYFFGTSFFLTKSK